MQIVPVRFTCPKRKGFFPNCPIFFSEFEALVFEGCTKRQKNEDRHTDDSFNHHLLEGASITWAKNMKQQTKHTSALVHYPASITSQANKKEEESWDSDIPGKSLRFRKGGMERKRISFGMKWKLRVKRLKILQGLVLSQPSFWAGKTVPLESS